MRPLPLAWLAFATLAATAPARAQHLAIYGSGGYSFNSPYSKLYNPNTVVRFSGKVTGLTTGAPMAGLGESVRMIVRANNGGSMLVEIGPAWYVNRQALRLKVRDRVSIVGSKVMLDGRGTVLASQITRGRSGLVLRDAEGNPYWAAARIGQTVGVAGNDNPQTNQRIAIQPVNPGRPIYAAPGILNGTIQGFNVRNGEVFMALETGANNVQTVSLGPLWYIERQDVALNPGDLVTVNVLTPLSGGNGVVYGQQLSVNGNSVYFRTSTGVNMWSPWFPTVNLGSVGQSMRP